MTLPKLLYYIGIALIVYALISGAHFYYKFDSSGSHTESGYSVKFGLLICGVVILYLSKRLKN